MKAYGNGGGVGTIFVKASTETFGELSFDNFGNSTGGAAATLTRVRSHLRRVAVLRRPKRA